MTPRKKIIKPKEESDIPKGMKLFDFLKVITQTKQDLTDDDLRTYEPYIINMALASVQLYLPIIRQLNDSFYMTHKRQHFEMLRNIIPKKFVNIGFNNVQQSAELKWRLSTIRKHFEVGTRDAQMLNDYTPKDEMDIILSKYRIK